MWRNWRKCRDPETGQITARVKRDYRALIPLLRHRYEPDNPAVKEILNRPRDVHMSIDAALQMRASRDSEQASGEARKAERRGRSHGSVGRYAGRGQLSMAIAGAVRIFESWPGDAASGNGPARSRALRVVSAGIFFQDRDGDRGAAQRPGARAPALSTACACRTAGSAILFGSARFATISRIRSHTARSTFRRASSCRAMRTSLNWARTASGSRMLYDTASKLGISVAQPNTPQKLQQYLPQASYGQGQVVVSPFQMARVAATIANGGNAPQGRWIMDETNPRVRPPQPLLPPSLAEQIAGYMRGVVTSGTGRVLNASPIPIAGKTGTAELAKAPSHAWFIGFAPYGAKGGKQIAFAVLVENGQYGGTAAAPIAGEIVAAARQLGII